MRLYWIPSQGIVSNFFIIQYLVIRQLIQDQLSHLIKVRRRGTLNSECMSSLRPSNWLGEYILSPRSSHFRIFHSIIMDTRRSKSGNDLHNRILSTSYSNCGKSIIQKLIYCMKGNQLLRCLPEPLHASMYP